MRASEVVISSARGGRVPAPAAWLLGVEGLRLRFSNGRGDTFEALLRVTDRDGAYDMASLFGDEWKHAND